MKKRLLQVFGIVLCFALLWLCGVKNVKDYVVIEDEKLPLQNSAGTLLCEQEEDITIIPDRYNTGAQGKLTPVTSDCYISGVLFKTGNKLNLYYQPKGVEIPDTIVVENYDFSSTKFSESDVDKVTKAVTIIYRNCKFQSYNISGVGLIKRQFENCTFTHFSGSDATFINCYFGSGADGDGVDPKRNCTFINCMIADLIQQADVAGEIHVDGFQIFGCQNGMNNSEIKFENCRFEMPYISVPVPSGKINCPIAIIMRYSDANNISFNNCHVNGGLYYGIMVFQYEQKVTNLSFNNIKVGGASKHLYTGDGEFKDMMSKKVNATDSLYVASVRKLEDGVHISVTNDTNQERTLSIVSNMGRRNISIPACPKGLDISSDIMTYADYPFDIDILVEDAEWIACFDTTDGVEQIRFVNWSGAPVYVDMDEQFSNIVTNGENKEELAPEIINPEYFDKIENDIEKPVYTGMCGDNVKFVLEDGTLTLSGEGNTYNYHSKKLPPWYEMRENISKVKIEEGITKLGNQLFIECANLNDVILSEGLVEIGNNAFIKCKKIKYIYITHSVQKIGERNFSSKIETVEYDGTKEEWEKIIVGQYNSGILETEIVYETIVDSGVCGDNVTWSLDSNGKLSLVGTGGTYNYHSKKLPPWYSYASEVKEIYISEGITAIGNCSFKSCNQVTSVKIPSTVVSIGINAFNGCKKLNRVELPAILESIGGYAFAATSVKEIYYAGNEEQWKVIEGNPFAESNVIYK